MSLQAEFASGAIFGIALLLSGVYAPGIVRTQMLFTNLHMLQVFLGGSATSAIVLHIADKAGILGKKHRSPSNLGLFLYDDNLVGGILIGLGMAATGACPGTSMTQLGAGMANGVFAVLGGVIGASVFLRVRPRLQSNEAAAPGVMMYSPSDNPLPTTASKSLDIPTALSIHPLTMLLLWIPMCVAVIGLAQVVDRSRLQSYSAGLLPPAFGGLLIGLAQAGTVLLTNHHIGASTAYADLARWAAHKYTGHRTGETTTAPSLMTPSIAFAAGIVCSAAVLKPLVLGPQETGIETFTLGVPSILRTIFGGACMVFGARLAGGCTSGHGISGLSKFSLASLATTSAIFAGGMVSAQLLRS